jgi:hypothetical protein
VLHEPAIPHEPASSARHQGRVPVEQLIEYDAAYRKDTVETGPIGSAVGVHDERIYA